MKKRLLALFLVFCLLLPAAGLAAPTEKQVYKAMIKLKRTYPEGMRWTNANGYAWNGGIYYMGFGCAGFAFILSDAAFGDAPARIVKLKDFEGLKVGDILRVYNDSHSVIILKTGPDSITLAEGNYNSSIHWGRVMTKNETKRVTNYVMTRYPKIGSLEAPANLRVTAGAGNAAVLKWNKSESASFYDVYRKQGSGKWKKIATVTKTSYTDETADGNTIYRYSVKAGAKSNASLVSSARSSAVSYPSVSIPKNVTAQSAKKGRITVKWKKAGDAQRYEIYATTSKKVPGDKTEATAVAEGTKATLRKLRSGKTYYVYVRSVRESGETVLRGPWSKGVTVRVK